MRIKKFKISVFSSLIFFSLLFVSLLIYISFKDFSDSSNLSLNTPVEVTRINEDVSITLQNNSNLPLKLNRNNLRYLQSNRPQLFTYVSNGGTRRSHLKSIIINVNESDERLQINHRSNNDELLFSHSNKMTGDELLTTININASDESTFLSNANYAFLLSLYENSSVSGLNNYKDEMRGLYFSSEEFRNLIILEIN